MLSGGDRDETKV